jgi:predicted small metal-binding protein
MPGCDFQAKGTEDEILAAAGKHATEDHGLEITDELVEKVKGAIKDE